MMSPIKILPLLVILFCSRQVLGQTLVLSGIITDTTTHEPLRNASVYNKVNKRGVRSDSLGRFVLPVGAGKTTLVVSMIGYSARTIAALSPGNDSLVITLMPEAEKMEQVVVTNKRGKYRNKDN